MGFSSGAIRRRMEKKTKPVTSLGASGSSAAQQISAINKNMRNIGWQAGVADNRKRAAEGIKQAQKGSQIRQVKRRR